MFSNKSVCLYFLFFEREIKQKEYSSGFFLIFIYTSINLAAPFRLVKHHISPKIYVSCAPKIAGKSHSTRKSNTFPRPNTPILRLLSGLKNPEHKSRKFCVYFLTQNGSHFPWMNIMRTIPFLLLFITITYVLSPFSRAPMAHLHPHTFFYL